MKRALKLGFLLLLFALGFFLLRNLNHQNQNQLLIQGAQISDLERLKLALRRGADINSRSSKGETALIITLRNGKIGGPEYALFLLQNGADVRVKSRKGQTPVSLALAFGGEVPVLNALVSRGAELSPENALHFAVLRHDIAGIKKCLDAGTNINCREPNGFTPLMWAAFDGASDVVKLLLQRGANPRLESFQGETSLEIAELENLGDEMRHAKTLALLRAAQKAR